MRENNQNDTPNWLVQYFSVNVIRPFKVTDKLHIISITPEYFFNSIGEITPA